MMPNNSNKIEFNFTYYAMKLLGKNLYSSPWTAVSEIVANGIDAGAESIYVLVDMINKENAVVEIFDNGRGMSYDDLAEKYALIGRNKRQSNDNSQGKTLGRKGIGKLAALYLSSQYVLSSKSQNEISTWLVDTTKFKDSDIPTLNRIPENLFVFTAKEFWDKCKTGTMIHLSNVDLRRIGEEKIKRLSAILADYYLSSIIKSKIYVCVREKKGQRIEFSEIGKTIHFETMFSLFDNTGLCSNQLNKAVYLTECDELEAINYPRSTTTLDVNKYNCTGTISMVDLAGDEALIPYELKGWIGVHVSLKKDILLRNVKAEDKSKYILRPNAIRLYVRGKLAVDNLMNYIGSNQAFANYIEGELSFDVLDDDSLEDSSTSSREGYTLTDPRIQKLIEIAGKICSDLIRERSRIGTQINQEQQDHINHQLETERLNKEKEEQRRKEIEKRNAELAIEKQVVEEKLDKTVTDLGSEKRRNTFLRDSLSEDQMSYSKKLHMVKINSSTISNVISGLVIKKRREVLTMEHMWNGLKSISYCNARIKAILEYYAIAEFDPKNESVEGDLFEFIVEYCGKVTQKVCEAEDQDIIISTEKNLSFTCRFVPQNIGVLIDNVISNSYKNRAKSIVFTMYFLNQRPCIDIVDDGRGLDRNVNADEIFEFGKSFTNHGTGVGLYHVRQIVEEMGGTISVNTNRKGGFELNVRY